MNQSGWEIVQQILPFQNNSPIIYWTKHLQLISLSTWNYFHVTCKTWSYYTHEIEDWYEKLYFMKGDMWAIDMMTLIATTLTTPMKIHLIVSLTFYSVDCESELRQDIQRHELRD